MHCRHLLTLLSESAYNTATLTASGIMLDISISHSQDSLYIASAANQLAYSTLSVISCPKLVNTSSLCRQRFVLAKSLVFLI